MSSRCSRESEASTSASNEPDTPSSANAKPTSGGDGSSGNGSPECRSTRTLLGFQVSGYGGQVAEGEMPTLQASYDRPSNQMMGILTSSAEDSRAKTSPSQDADAASQESEAGCSSSSPESLTLFSDPEGGSSLRTFPDSFPPTVAEISQSYSRRWPSSGSTTSPGECWTHDTSESPSAGAASSSLPDVLVEAAHERFYLSPKAASGILRRAEKRGKALPGALESALRQLSKQTEGTV